jgi:hypothetical protein
MFFIITPNIIIKIPRRQVSYEEGENLAKENGLMILEVSAKTAHNVEDAFTLSAKQILENIDNNRTEIQSKGMKLSDEDKKKKNDTQNCGC